MTPRARSPESRRSVRVAAADPTTLTSASSVAGRGRRCRAGAVVENTYGGTSARAPGASAGRAGFDSGRQGAGIATVSRAARPASRMARQFLGSITRARRVAPRGGVRRRRPHSLGCRHRGTRRRPVAGRWPRPRLGIEVIADAVRAEAVVAERRMRRCRATQDIDQVATPKRWPRR